MKVRLKNKEQLKAIIECQQELVEEYNYYGGTAINNKDYLVSAIHIKQGEMEYYIDIDESHYLPSPVSSVWFEITDSQVNSERCVGTISTGGSEKEFL